MNNNKLKNTNSAIFIAAVLVAGTFAMVSPLTVYAQQYGQDSYYPSDPGMNDKSHSKIQKADCDNKNINVNGVDLTQRQDLVDNTLAGSADDASIAGQELSPEEAFAAISGSGDPLINAERNIVNVCINDNDNDITNTVTATQTQPGTPGEEEDTACLDCFRSLDAQVQIDINAALGRLGDLTITGTLPLVIIPAAVNDIAGLCEFLDDNHIILTGGAAAELALVNLIAAQITGSVAIAQTLVDCLQLAGIIVIT
jgi:hypothetical protein